MCGITGAYSRQNILQFFSEAEFANASKLQNHRGPDDSGQYLDQHVLLGHQRLSIIDIHSGHQPLADSNGRYWTVFNGEIYNYIELRDELTSLGCKFQTDSDTEVIVNGYATWGTDCFRRFRGMFAIAIWDTAQRELILARDPIGKKPLYIFADDKKVVFSSELKPIHALVGSELSLNHEAVWDYMLLGYIPTPGSIYQKVSKLEPGTFRKLTPTADTTEQFFNLEFEPKTQASEGELTEQLLEILNESVKIRLRSDVEFGAFLSGGLDSSLVAFLMAKNMTSQLKTFSIDFDQPEFSEIEDARRIARHIGSDHHEFTVKADALNVIDMLTDHFDEPFADSSAIPTYLVAQMAAKHVKMVQSGDGGDETFAGYTRYTKHQQLQRLRRAGLGLAPLAARLGAGVLPNPYGNRLKGIASRLAQGYPASYLSGVALATPEFCADILSRPGDDRGYSALESRFQHGHANEMDNILHGDIRSYLIDDVMVKVDRMTMAHALEARSPLLDHELVQWSSKLDYSMKVRGPTSKYLLRKVAAQMLPMENINKRKQGFAVPLAHWFRSDLKELSRDIFHSERFAQRGIFDAATVQGRFDEHQSGAADHSETLWQCLIFELWSNKYTVGVAQ